MIALSYKAKHYGLIALKVLILAITFQFIFRKLSSADGVSLANLIDVISAKASQSFFWILLFFGLAFLNWSLEILKWQTVVSSVKKISFSTSAVQCLYALTVSLATPNRIGDYGAKAFFYPSEDRKKILLQNLLSNGWQMLITTFFGILGLTLVIANYGLEISYLKITLGIGIILLLGILGYFFKEKELIIKGLSIKKVMSYFRNIPSKIIYKTGILAALRYGVFSFLFFLLLLFFNAQVSISEAIPLIFSMYLLVSIVPSIFIFDVVIRGGVAVALFSLIGVDEWTVLAAVLSMWILNFAIPAILGSYFMMTYKPAYE